MLQSCKSKTCRNNHSIILQIEPGISFTHALRQQIQSRLYSDVKHSCLLSCENVNGVPNTFQILSSNKTFKNFSRWRLDQCLSRIKHDRSPINTSYDQRTATHQLDDAHLSITNSILPHHKLASASMLYLCQIA
jgi:hypothetical protein